MFSKFKLFRKTEPAVDTVEPEVQEHLEEAVDPSALEDQTPLAAEIRKQPSVETIKRIREEIEQVQKFFSDRAQFGIGMACNAAQDPIQLRSFVDFNQYDVKSENPSFWKLQTQSGLMFGQLTENGVSVYPAEVNKNEPFENSKLGRGLASFGPQFQPEVAQSKPVMTPVGTVTSAQIDEALQFCQIHKSAIAIALLSRQLPDGAHCDLACVRRMRITETGAKRISLGLRLRNNAGVTKSYRLLMDAEKAVLIEQDKKVIASITADIIQTAATDCQLD
jgi:hypothetical protein